MSHCNLGLSCEPTISSVKYCMHGRFPLTCEWCLIERMRLEIIDLRNRTESFHAFKLRQCDENKESNGNIDELIEINKSLVDRVEKLEHLTKFNMSPQIKEFFDLGFKGVWEKFEQLEMMIDVDKIQLCIFEGAMTHSIILKCDAKIEEQDARIKELERFQEITHLEYRRNYHNKKQHDCTNCT